MGSAIAIGPNRLVTCAHIWAPCEPWWKSEVPSQAEFCVFAREFERTVVLDGERATASFPDRITRAVFRLVLSGWPLLEVDADGEATRQSVNDCDWAVIETESPSWGPEDIAVIHEPARDPDWVVPDGTELFILGYSPMFMGDSSREGAGSGSATADPDSDNLISFIRGGPYTLKGKAGTIDGICSVTYPHEWPQPGGHSGGGVFIWNEEARQLELVGVFHTWAEGTRTETFSYALFGISGLEMQRTREMKIRRLRFAPIAHACRTSAPILD